MTTSNKNELSISILVVIGLLVVVGLIYLFVFSVAEDGFGKNMERVNQEMDDQLLERIRPVVTLEDITGGKQQQEQASAQVLKSPQDLYAGACLACHDTGVAGAPKLADAAAWEPRFANGIEALLKTAVAGKGAMPPNGGSTYSEQEMLSIIEFMLSQAGLMDAPAAIETATVETTPAPAVEQPQQFSEPETSQGAAYDTAAGEQAYRGACFACHDTGAAGAPKIGDPLAWSSRLASGFDVMLQSAINGKGAMPPKGGAAYLSDIEVANIVAFMIEKSK